MSLCTHRLTDKTKLVDNSAPGTYKQTVSIPAGLFNQGVFNINLYFADARQESDIAAFNQVIFFKVHKSDYSFNIFTYKGNFSGALFPMFNWNSEKES
jgi:hypothetical protein